MKSLTSFNYLYWIYLMFKMFSALLCGALVIAAVVGCTNSESPVADLSEVTPTGCECCGEGCTCVGCPCADGCLSEDGGECACAGCAACLNANQLCTDGCCTEGCCSKGCCDEQCCGADCCEEACCKDTCCEQETCCEKEACCEDGTCSKCENSEEQPSEESAD